MRFRRVDLPQPVATHQADVFAGGQGEVSLLQEFATGDAVGEVLNDQHGQATAGSRSLLGSFTFEDLAFQALARCRAASRPL